MFSQEFQNNSEVSTSGIKIALVVDNNDPKACERVLVRVVGVHDMSNTKLDNAVWADRIAFSKFSSGDIPDVGDYLYVIFPDYDNISRLLWLGWCRGNVE
jgi:hypothetical protein